MESPENPPASDPAAARILVCDDDASLRELVRAVLGPRYAFTEASDGKEALAAVQHDPPDLLVLDIMLPGLGGLDVLAAIRADERISQLPVVVITAWDHAEAQAWSAGADRVVTKPFDPDVLSSAVEELLP